MIYGLALIILGIISVPSLLLSRKPDAKKIIDKITPYQGYIGIVFTFWGAWGIISCILNLNLLSLFPIYWIIWLLASVVEAALGFILAYGLNAKHLLSKNEETAKKGEQLLAKLLPLQGKLGISAIILGIVQIISSFIWVVG